jgi:hypothetical protein
LEQIAITFADKYSVATPNLRAIDLKQCLQSLLSYTNLSPRILPDEFKALCYIIAGTGMKKDGIWSKDYKKPS